MKTILIPIHDSRKSFYGKATVITECGNTYLKSYDTVVCYVDTDNVLHRTWDGYSATTMRHIKEFTTQILGHAITKKEWDSMAVEPEPKL